MFKSSEKQQEFSIEKIASAIHAEHLVSSLKNKYIDPNILFRRKLPNLKVRHKRQITDIDSFSLSNLLIKEFLSSKPDKNNSKNLLPIISPVNSKEKNDNKFIATSGMFREKDCYREPFQKLKIGNVMNNRTNDDSIYQSLYPKLENMKTINDKYNLDLSLKHLNEEQHKNKSFKLRAFNNKDLLYYLYNKYIIPTNKNNNNTKKSETTSNYNNNENFNIQTNKKKLKNNRTEIDEANSMTINKIYENDNINKILLRNEKSSNKKTFITKINIKTKSKSKIADETKQPKGNMKETIKIIKPKKIVFSNLLNKNKNIMEHDKKIFVDCLYSKVLSTIDENNLIYNPLGNTKTNYAITKEPSYHKIKKFESIIDDIIKIKKDITLSTNK